MPLACHFADIQWCTGPLASTLHGTVARAPQHHAQQVCTLCRLCVSAGSILSVAQLADGQEAPGPVSSADWLQGMQPLLGSLGAGLQDAAADADVLGPAIEAASTWSAETGAFSAESIHNLHWQQAIMLSIITHRGRRALQMHACSL